MISAEQWIFNALQPLNLPCSLGKNPPTVSLPYISIYHALDDIQHQLSDGQVSYHASIVHIEFESANPASGLVLCNQIKALLLYPAVFLQEGQTIVAPAATGSGASPPLTGDRRFLMYFINLTLIN